MTETEIIRMIAGMHRISAEIDDRIRREWLKMSLIQVQMEVA